MYGILASLLAKPKLIFGTYEGHTVNISQLCHFPKGKERIDFCALKKAHMLATVRFLLK